MGYKRNSESYPLHQAIVYTTHTSVQGRLTFPFARYDCSSEPHIIGEKCWALLALSESWLDVDNDDGRLRVFM